MMKLPRFYLSHLISIRVYTGQNGYGEAVFGGTLDIGENEISSYDPLTGIYQVRARVEVASSVLLDTESRNTNESTIAYFNGKDLPMRSEITFDGYTYTVTSVRRIYSPYGISHLEVTMQ